jgi:hypothetical protein
MIVIDCYVFVWMFMGPPHPLYTHIQCCWALSCAIGEAYMLYYPPAAWVVIVLRRRIERTLAARNNLKAMSARGPIGETKINEKNEPDTNRNAKTKRENASASLKPTLGPYQFHGIWLRFSLRLGGSRCSRRWFCCQGISGISRSSLLFTLCNHGFHASKSKAVAANACAGTRREPGALCARRGSATRSFMTFRFCASRSIMARRLTSSSIQRWLFVSPRA